MSENFDTMNMLNSQLGVDVQRVLSVRDALDALGFLFGKQQLCAMQVS